MTTKIISTEEWALALESGKYEQGKGRLHKDGLFCCLGVLCNIIDKSKWVKHANHTFKMWDTCTAILPASIRIIPLNQEEYPSIEGDLTTMNDSGNKSFKEIAQFIRENVKEIRYEERKNEECHS